MSVAKIAISMDETLLQQLDRLVKNRSFRSRSQVVQEAVAEKISRMDKSALARECAKLDRKSEQAMADEGLASEIPHGPNIERRYLLGRPRPGQGTRAVRSTSGAHLEQRHFQPALRHGDRDAAD